MNESPNNDHVERILALAEKMAEEKKNKKGGPAKAEEVAEWRKLSVTVDRGTFWNCIYVLDAVPHAAFWWSAFCYLPAEPAFLCRDDNNNSQSTTGRDLLVVS